MNIALEQHVNGNVGDLESIESGVSVFWLAKHFSLEVSTVRKKMAGCRALKRKTSGHLYLLKDAASYLVTPKMDPEQLIRSMKSQDLPPHLQNQFWQAALARLRWEREAGDLWETEDVLEALGAVFKLVKSSAQLWPDTVAEMIGLSDEQRIALLDQIDVLLNEIHTSIKESAVRKSTQSAFARLEELLEAPEELFDVVLEGEDDGISELI